MNISTTEFLPSVQSAYHGRNNQVDVNTENTFRWPHGISDRVPSTPQSTTNGYTVGTERATTAGLSVDTSARFDFRCMNDAYRYHYDTVPTKQEITPSPSTSSQHQQQQQQTDLHHSATASRYDFFDNHYQNRNASITNATEFFKKEQPSLDMEIPTYNQVVTTTLPLPPTSVPPVPSTPQQTFDPRYSTSLPNFQTPAYQNKQDVRLSYEEETRNRSYLPNFESHFQSLQEAAQQQSTQRNSEDSKRDINNLNGTLQSGINQDIKPSLYREIVSQHQSTVKKEEHRSINQDRVNNSVKSTDDQVEQQSNKPDVKQELKDNDSSSPSKNNDSKSASPSQDNGLPSYTAMIAQAILKKESSKSTLSDIYEYMEKHFPSLEKRGTGWRNCVRHTLSLNDCFIKLHRPENGRSCNWAIHPTYYESFSRGDYRKRRALRKRPRGLQWIDPAMLAGYPFAREHDVYSDMHQQSPFYHYPPPPPPSGGSMHPASPQSYYHSSTNFNQTFSLPSGQLQQSHNSPNVQHYSNHQAYPHQSSGHHLQSAHCTNPDCYCQYSKQTNNRVYTP